jgi:hypothetical protein
MKPTPERLDLIRTVYSPTIVAAWHESIRVTEPQFVWMITSAVVHYEFCDESHKVRMQALESVIRDTAGDTLQQAGGNRERVQQVFARESKYEAWRSILHAVYTGGWATLQNRLFSEGASALACSDEFRYVALRGTAYGPRASLNRLIAVTGLAKPQAWIWGGEHDFDPLSLELSILQSDLICASGVSGDNAVKSRLMPARPLVYPPYVPQINFAKK